MAVGILPPMRLAKDAHGYFTAYIMNLMNAHNKIFQTRTICLSLKRDVRYLTHIRGEV
jgi:hypothetical protein